MDFDEYMRAQAAFQSQQMQMQHLQRQQQQQQQQHPVPLPVAAPAFAPPPAIAAFHSPPVAAPPPEEDEEAIAAAAAARKAAAEAMREAEALRREENSLLRAAAEIRDQRSVLRTNPFGSDLKSRGGKTHWDHVMEEMQWMAKEFQRERRWKLQQARKTANAVARSNLDLESRVEVRAKEEQKAIRKHAAWIAKEVSEFWAKAQRVVQFKVRTEVEAKKKEVLDRQLDVLLGQTQKYSTLLAQRLAADERVEAVAAASMAPDNPAVTTAPAPAAVQQPSPAAKAALSPTQLKQLPPAKPLPPSAAVSGTGVDTDNTKDYRSGEDDDADDEATLEEEERMAAAEGRNLKVDEKEEAAGLEEDADLPLDELLARYGYVVPEDGDEVKPAPAAAVVPLPGAVAVPMAIDVEQDDDGAGAAGSFSDAESEQLAALLEDHGDGPAGGSGLNSLLPSPRPSRLAVEFAELSDEEGAGSVDEAGPSNAAAERDSGAGPAAARRLRRRGGAAAAAGTSRGGGVDEEEYRSGEDDDADDEATLEEEAKMAAAEGRNLAVDEKEEAAGLAEDADLPLEELLARYGYVVPGEEKEEAAAGKAEEAGPSNAAVRAAASPSCPSGRPPLPPSSSKGGAAAAAAGTSSAAAGTVGAAIGGEEGAGAEAGPAPEEMGIAGTMEAMAAAQPTGFTLETTKVKTPVPFLLKGTLREYQHIGLDWLVTLYHRRLNGILADEMGLGKTIQTIALLAWLACERGDWGPHLIVVPTSVMLNWEMEFKRWCPAFKLLTYYGSPKERAAKRQGWSKPNAFHVCITSYTLVLQDSRMFKRKKWKYLVLDEAHMIKNWRSQRWQNLLNFNSKRRLLITGTPLQNDLMELWSLMHFLMPQVFGSHAQFKDWFSNPLTGMVEGSAEYNKAIVERLHGVLRPFLLRRLKRDVEKQLPGKHEHLVKCRLSKRQRQLYEEYMASGNTRATLSSGNFLGIMNCLMQLRKVCNHPDLFEGRPIVSALDMAPMELAVPSAVAGATEAAEEGLAALLAQRGLTSVVYGAEMEGWEAGEVEALALGQEAFLQPATSPQEDVALLLGGASGSLLAALRRSPSRAAVAAVAHAAQALATRRRLWRRERTAALGRLSLARAGRSPALSASFAASAFVDMRAAEVHCIAATPGRHLDVSSTLLDMVKLPERRAAEMEQMLREFTFVIPKARAPQPQLWCSHPKPSSVALAAARARELYTAYAERGALLHVSRQRTQLFFPDKRLIQYDCGKLQELAALLMKLKARGSRALIFTQMSKMLDVLEAFLNLHAHTYVRLDGSTKPEQRQLLMQRFNSDTRIFCFILSTRSGGVGMNLTGADTVIFYDSDWNPAMDAQAQDRCHRIGQTREVHIYRLISEHTIEENILKKSDQKRQLDFLAIQSGGFTTDQMLTKFDPASLLEGTTGAGGIGSAAELQAAMRAAEDEGDAAAAAAAEREVAAEMDEFTKEPPPGAAGTEAGGEDDTGAPSEAAGTSNADLAGGSGADTGTAPAGGSGADAAVTAATAAIADADDGMAELAALAAAGAGGAGGPLAHLESALRPIERYAVRMVEADVPVVDATALAAQVEAAYKVDEFDVDAIEAAEEEREADIDDDEEANVVGDWDQAAATKAYVVQVEAAEAEERAREDAEAAWLADYEARYGALPVMEPSAGSGGTGGKRKAKARGKKSGAPSGLGAGDYYGQEDTAMSPGVQQRIKEEGGDAAGQQQQQQQKRIKRQRIGARPQPWEPAEDFVLASVVAMLLQAGELAGPGIWAAAADALAAGVAAESANTVEATARQGRLRNADACARRYSQLRAAYLAAATPNGGKENLGSTLGMAAVRAQLQALLRGAAAPGTHADALAAVYAALTKEGDSSASATALLQLFNALRATAAAPPAGAPLPPPPAPPAGGVGPLPEVQAIAGAVRQGCGQGATRFISARLPSVVEAARAGALNSNPAAAAAYPGGGFRPLNPAAAPFMGGALPSPHPAAASAFAPPPQLQQQLLRGGGAFSPLPQGFVRPQQGGGYPMPPPPPQGYPPMPVSWPQHPPPLQQQYPVAAAPALGGGFMPPIKAEQQQQQPYHPPR